MACGITGRNGSIQAKKESTWGTYITGDIAIKPNSENLIRNIEYVEDEGFIGEIYTTDMVPVYHGAGGSIEANAHPDVLGVIPFHSVMGAESTIANPFTGAVIVSYNGTSLYARLTKSTNNLVAELSSDGSSWSADTNFNTTGTIDLSASGFDTLTELQAAIAGYTGWDAYLIGSGTTASTTIPDFSATVIFRNDANNGSMLLRGVISSSVAKMHSLYPATSSTCLPSYSFTINRVLGTNKSLGYVGTKASSLALNIESAGIINYSLALTSKAEEVDKNDISLTIPTIKAYTASNAKILVVKKDGSQIEFTEVVSLNLTINTNIDEQKTIGSLYKSEQTRQKSTIELSFTAANITTQYAMRAEWIADNQAEVYLYIQGTDYADTTNVIYYNTLIRLNAIKLTAYNSPLSTPDRLMIDATATLIKPYSNVNTHHIDIYHTDTITSVY